MSYEEETLRELIKFYKKEFDKLHERLVKAIKRKDPIMSKITQKMMDTNKEIKKLQNELKRFDTED